MLKSMTGFGKAATTANDVTVTVEVRSLNSSKGMDLGAKLPSRYREYEHQLRQQITTKLQRGKVDVYVTVVSEKENAGMRLNKAIVKAHFNELNAIAKELNLPMEQVLPAILRLPDVYEDVPHEVESEEWLLIEKTIFNAIENLDAFRAKEGSLLVDDLLDRIRIIEHFVTHLKEQDKRRTAEMRQRLYNNVELYIPKDKIDTNRYEQEIIYYLEKLDITEELTRLRAHCDHFREAVADSSDEMKGRKLNFIAQEIGREINTVGSKANDAAIQKIVVNMKDELEKIKEQSNNVL
ncbi:MAG: YicC family protein [Chitinophagales bacterium]|nr:YicC family protein [Chitinophagales bacterium]HRP38372.1 YicC family protein [Chitinophagales bacterium]